MKPRITLGITGASGIIYAERLIEEIVHFVSRLYIVITPCGMQVLEYELSKVGTLLQLLNKKLKHEEVKFFKSDNFFAPIASGTSVADAMVVVPCSMGTLSRIAYGNTTNLLDRAADVTLKEGKKLILVPRESPYNSIHLENMLKLSKMGVHMVPPCPAFYEKPTTIEDIINSTVSKIIDLLGIENKIGKKWSKRQI